MAITPEDLEAKRQELADKLAELADVKVAADEGKEERERETVAEQLDAEIARTQRLINEAKFLSGQPIEEPEVPADPEISAEERKAIDAREAEALRAAEAAEKAAAEGSITGTAVTGKVAAPTAPKEGK